MRFGSARYALKRLRPDLPSDVEYARGALDLAIEIKFLSVLKHPNIVKMRGYSENKTRLSEEIQCCVCLDIQIHPRTLNPCGHTFCLGCVSKLETCPECREVVESHAPARMLDNLIATLVLTAV